MNCGTRRSRDGPARRLFALKDPAADPGVGEPAEEREAYKNESVGEQGGPDVSWPSGHGFGSSWGVVLVVGGVCRPTRRNIKDGAGKFYDGLRGRRSPSSAAAAVCGCW